jgi:hypothetical protein
MTGLVRTVTETSGIDTERFMRKSGDATDAQQTGSLRGHKFSKEGNGGAAVLAVACIFVGILAVGCIAAAAATQRYYLLAPGVPVLLVGGGGCIFAFTSPGYVAPPMYVAPQPRYAVFV